MNGNLEAVLYDCKHIGSIAQEIKDRIGMLRVIASEQNHRNVKEAYPNIGNVEEYIRRREAVKEIQALRACFSELADEMAVFPREAVFPDAADLYDEFRKEAKKMKKNETDITFKYNLTKHQYGLRELHIRSEGAGSCHRQQVGAFRMHHKRMR